ncbi:MAG: hypothetical protein V1818_03255 [Candidatus Aenigmatarchaeota archaeon]
MVLFCIPCLVLLAYFGVMSIFFPKYRSYIKDGWRCFVDKLKRKECSASFDNRMRLAVSMWFTERKMSRIGKFLHNKRNFEVTLIVIGIVTTIVSIYLFVLLIFYLIESPCADDVCAIEVG